MGKRKARDAAGSASEKPVPPDQDRREAIVTGLDTTMLVEASAGAGKTRSMVDRMIALVSEGKCRVETLAAITFTRKAAAELRARFQLALEKAAREAQGTTRQRLTHALDRVEQVFIGTIHSFCGRLLRERPVEAGVEPSFTELDEAIDARLKGEAWRQYVAERIVAADPLLSELHEFGLRIGDLEQAFLRFATYPDVDEWPDEPPSLPDLSAAREALQAYMTHLESLLPTLPEDPGNDKLMPKLRLITRLFRQVDVTRPAELMELLAEFGEPGKMTVVQKNWPGKKVQALDELEQWEEFVANTAAPLVSLWRQARYPVSLRVLKGAVAHYDRLREEAGGLNYQDLLLLAARLLRDKPQIRSYFRRRFTHLLVDEFQDTDPVQAEVMLLLTADDPTQQEWRQARPVAGALFVVGDPKQSIYRFRRADIETYNAVKRIIEQYGEVLALSANFRSRKPVIDWVNATFDQVFPEAADKYSPARSPMECATAEKDTDFPAAVEVLRIPTLPDIGAVLDYETQAVARTIQAALTGRNGWAKATPSDFLIISARKRNLSLYAARLHELGIPCEVTGGAVLNEIRELDLLCLCLEAVTEPDNAVALVAVLRSELFGLRDDALYAFRRAGGRFAFHATIPETVAAEVRMALGDAFERLQRYESWFRRLPPVAAIERVAADLGLLARAATNPGGNVLAGSMARAFELIRSAQATLFSLSDVVGYLRRLVDGEETHDGLPAATPPCPPVRIMNLHQAKGLEAPYVFLADPTGGSDHEPELYVDRSGNRVRGFLRICATVGEFSQQVLAYPVGWEQHAAQEKLYQDAERNRLLYVAATRAGSRLMVTQRANANKRNPWSPLEEYLADGADLKLPEAVECPQPPQRVLPADASNTAAAELSQRWSGVCRPGYALAAAKAISVTGSRLSPAAGEHGTEWGSVIHLLLETAMRDPSADLHPLASASLADQGLDPSFAADAVATVQAVMRSDVWERAQNSAHRLVEVPFQTLMPPDPNAADSVPMILRGVIDLVFREAAGWVVVDYKTDARTEGELPQLIKHYRGQIAAYADFWQATLGEPIAETGLYFTHLQRYAKL